MDLLQKQSYNLYYSYLLEKIMEWSKKKPQNKDLKNCLKAVAQIGIFNNQLLVEVDVLHKKNSMVRNEKNKIIDELKQELKQYEIRTE